ncbi:MAG: biotin transporter BioY [Firmicutes bacterium HGW-Firmicutes-7]|nr:MAG: biotin transporter BioY [Firmicutes bacterium HGW-Firmicutes-7]
MWTWIVSILVFIALLGIFTLIISKVEKNARNLTYAALFAALTAIGAWIKIPLPYVPFTMQVFFAIFSGILLGSRLGLLSQLVYILIGLIGVPVFTQGGGIGYIFQPTFGYLIGFAAAAYVTGLIVERLNKNTFTTYLVAALPGIAVIYLCGVPYLYIINALYLTKAFTFKMAVYYGFSLSIIGDLVSCIILCSIAPSIVKALAASKLLKRGN